MVSLPEAGHPGEHTGDHRVAWRGAKTDNAGLEDTMWRSNNEHKYLIPQVILSLTDQWPPAITIARCPPLPPGALHRILDSKASPLQVNPIAISITQEGQEASSQPPRLAEHVAGRRLPGAQPTPACQDAGCSSWEAAGVTKVPLVRKTNRRCLAAEVCRSFQFEQGHVLGPGRVVVIRVNELGSNRNGLGFSILWPTPTVMHPQDDHVIDELTWRMEEERRSSLMKTILAQ